MSVELPQNAISVVGERAGAAIASGAVTTGTGLSTYFELLPAVLGSIASAVGIIVSCGLFYLAVKKNRLERKQLHLTIAVLEEKEAERLDRAASRLRTGEPVRRAEDSPG